jgi:hypothetical protein
MDLVEGAALPPPLLVVRRGDYAGPEGGVLEALLQARRRQKRGLLKEPLGELSESR